MGPWVLQRDRYKWMVGDKRGDVLWRYSILTHGFEFQIVILRQNFEVDREPEVCDLFDEREDIPFPQATSCCRQQEHGEREDVGQGWRHWVRDSEIAIFHKSTSKKAERP